MTFRLDLRYNKRNKEIKSTYHIDKHLKQALNTETLDEINLQGIDN